MAYLVSESYVNATQGYRYGDTEPEDYGYDNLGELYRALRRENGRCVGKVYTDKDGAIGWVFVKRVPYDDSDETYLREVWVTVHTAPDTVTRERHYASVG